MKSHTKTQVKIIQEMKGKKTPENMNLMQMSINVDT